MFYVPGVVIPQHKGVMYKSAKKNPRQLTRRIIFWQR